MIALVMLLPVVALAGGCSFADELPRVVAGSAAIIDDLPDVLPPARTILSRYADDALLRLPSLVDDLDDAQRAKLNDSVTRASCRLLLASIDGERLTKEDVGLMLFPDLAGLGLGEFAGQLAEEVIKAAERSQGAVDEPLLRDFCGFLP